MCLFLPVAGKQHPGASPWQAHIDLQTLTCTVHLLLLTPGCVFLSFCYAALKENHRFFSLHNLFISYRGKQLRIKSDITQISLSFINTNKHKSRPGCTISKRKARKARKAVQTLVLYCIFKHRCFIAIWKWILSFLNMNNAKTLRC